MRQVDNFWSCLKYFNNYDINALAFGHVYVDNPESWKFMNFSAPFNKLYFIKKGEIIAERLNNDGTIIKTYHLLPGNVYIIPCNNLYNLYITNEVSKYFIHFNITLNDGEDIFMGMNKIVSAPCSLQPLDNIKNDLDKGDIWAVLKAKSIAYESIINILEFNNVSILDERLETISHYSSLILNALQYINENIRADLNITEISEYLRVSQHVLYSEFKSQIYITLKRYIIKKLGEKSKIMLLTTDLTIKEIAVSLKFNDQYTFSKFFKKEFGSSPSEFRKMALNYINK